MRRIEAAGIVLPPPGEAGQAAAKYRRRLAKLLELNGLSQTSADHPIDVIFARGMLSALGEEKGNAEQRRRAGIVLSWLSAHIVGRPFSSAIDLGIVVPALEAPEPTRRPDWWDQLTDDQKERWHELWLRRMYAALKRAGRHVEAVTMNVAVYCLPPRSAQLAALLRGLDAISRVAAPQQDEL